MLKISAGEFRSRILLTPPDERSTRPYSSRAREAVFNLLRGWFEGARVLDLFAGVGSLGLEAVSRGASRVVLVERDREVARYLRANIKSLDCDDRATAVLSDALAPTAIAAAPAPCDIIFFDPPYPQMQEEESLVRILQQVGRCRQVMAAKSFLVLRSPIPPDARFRIAGFKGPEVHHYGGDMHVLLYAPSAEDAQLSTQVAAEVDTLSPPTSGASE
ncbi:MAG: 16S rRNA (guanine(966)-N(2))-methyltransferase RsmD [Phycisphaerales bacterium]|nr:16S rRNA (guanine(966)-N(2))-methyltransferase RsmD [Phycisphaerales bacterium]